MTTGSITIIAEGSSVPTEDHVVNALARLPLQFTDKPNVRAVLTALVTPMQTIEDTIASIIVQRSVNVAAGVTLTMLGTLIGQDRLGITDDEIFRRYVRARIGANKSNGLPVSLYNVARLVLNDSRYKLVLRNEGTATARLAISSASIGLDDAVAQVLGTMLEVAVAAGVRLVLEWSGVPDADTFTLDVGPGLDAGMLAGSLDNGVVL